MYTNIEKEVYWFRPKLDMPRYVSSGKQSLKFASAVSKCRGFCQCISVFFSICLGKKKNAEAIKFLGILYVFYFYTYFALLYQFLRNGKYKL